MAELITITTKEHFNKYSELKKGIDEDTLKHLVEDLYKNKKELVLKFKEDLHLNNISMFKIDFKDFETRRILRDKISIHEGNKVYTTFSQAENCSFIKHILIYNILGVKPFFEEDILNYPELYNKWKGLSPSVTYPKGKPYYSLGMWFLDNKSLWIFKNNERRFKK